MLDQYLEKLRELQQRNESFVLAVVVRREAPSSGKAGDKAVITRYGEIHGWLGGGCVKGIVLKESDDALKTGMPRLVRIGKHLMDAQPQQGVKEYKMTCQSEGTVEIFIEAVLPQPHVVVIGKTAIAKALVRLAKASGFRVTGVAQDANLQTFEKVDELITRISLLNVKTTKASCIVVATQGDQDELALAEALKKEAGYIGFVASRKKMASMIDYLTDAGLDKKRIEAIHSPAGIDINAKQPEEVAISIMAELVKVRNSGSFHTGIESAPAEDESVTATPEWYINPVCGVPVDIHHPKHVVMYKDEKVYFCCDGCKVKFDKDPEQYMQARALGLEPEGM